MGVNSGGQGGRALPLGCAPWIFMYNTDKVEGSYWCYFSSCFYPLTPLPPENFFADGLAN